MKTKSEIPLQEAYCKKMKLPVFAPHNGICFKCGAKIKDTDKKHITGCEVCGYSFCE